MNENKMMSYEMYEELKSSILKTIKTEIANVKPATMPPNNLPQQIEQAVSNGLAQYGTTLDGISESFTAKQTEVLSGVKSLQETVSAIEIPKELPPRLHNHRHIIGSEAKSIIIFFVTSIVMMIFMAIAVWNAYQPNVQRDDNDLKYRYMKMKGEADARAIGFGSEEWREDIFGYLGGNSRAIVGNLDLDAFLSIYLLGISFRFLPHPHEFSKFSSRKVNLHHCYYSLPRILFNSSIVRVVSYTGTIPIVSSISFK